MRRLPMREFSMLLALLAVWAFFAWREPVFFSARNLSLLSVELSITASLALGMLLVLLPGQIDLSAGSGVGLAGAIAAVLVYGSGTPAPWAMVLATLAIVATWAAMGALVVIEQVPAFIITLGGLLVFRGIHWALIHGSSVPIMVGGQPNALASLTTWYLPAAAGYALVAGIAAATAWIALAGRRRRARHGLEPGEGEQAFLRWFIGAQAVLLAVVVANGFRGVPLALIVLGAIAVAVHVLAAHTPFGRYLYAIGGNEEAAVLSGVPVRAAVVGAFAVMGLIVAITGFMQTAYAGASTSTVGSLMELDAVAACVMGGVSLRGGRGNVAGVLFGALIMASLLNGMTLMAVSPEAKYVVRGAVLVLAVWLDRRMAGARPA